MDVAIRPATPADRSRVLDIVYGAPLGEMLALCGDAESARRLGEQLLDYTGFPSGLHETVIAETDGAASGVLSFATAGTGSPAPLEFVRMGLRAFGGAGALRRIPQALARLRVDLPDVAGQFYIAEIHVDPQLRGRGLGGYLLDWAESTARARGFDCMWLTTGSTNPARRLYRRHGFEVTREARSRSYERLSGMPGRVRMEKGIGPAS